MSEEPKVEIGKTITEQITDAMIEKLQESEHFSEEMLSVLQMVDLTNKNAVSEAITNGNEEQDNEATETGN